MQLSYVHLSDMVYIDIFEFLLFHNFSSLLF